MYSAEKEQKQFQMAAAEKERFGRKEINNH